MYLLRRFIRRAFALSLCPAEKGIETVSRRTLGGHECKYPLCLCPAEKGIETVPMKLIRGENDKMIQTLSLCPAEKGIETSIN